jgi:hypothetical protein
VVETGLATQVSVGASINIYRARASDSRVVQHDPIFTPSSADNWAMRQTGVTVRNIALRAELVSTNGRLWKQLPELRHSDTRVRYSRMTVERIAVAAFSIFRLSVR